VFCASNASRIQNFHSAVFEILVPFEYRNNEEYRAVEKTLNALLETEEQLDKELTKRKRAYKKAKKQLHAKQAGSKAKKTGKQEVKAETSLFVDQQQLRNLKFELEQVRHEKEDLDEEKTKLDIIKKRLYRLARADDKLNDGEQSRQTTNPLKFGDTIQFKHKYSDKFLCIKEASSAMLEPNAVRVTMQDYSSRDCLFKIMPRFKVRNEGEQVQAGDQIQIVAEHVRGYALQRSDTPITEKFATFHKELGSFEVCLTSAQTTWTIGMYTKAHPADIVESSIKAGDIVQLSDKEMGGIISMAEMCAVDIKEKRPLSELPVAPKKHQGYLNKGIDDDGGYLQESLSYWQVYRFGEISYGGPLKYHEPIVLRHLVSGRYIALRGSGTDGDIELKFVENFDSRQKEASDFAFFFEPGLHFAGGNEVAPDAVLRLFHEKSLSYLTTHKEPLHALDIQTYTQFRAKKEKAEEEDVAIRQKVVFQRKDKFTYEDVIVIRAVDDADIDDFALVNSLIPFLDLAIEATQPEKVATYPSERKRLGKERSKTTDEVTYYERSGKDIIGCAILAFAELSKFVLDHDEDDDHWGESAIARQGLLQDLGVLDKIVAMLSDPLTRRISMGNRWL
jgi:hypothetical protein